MLKRIMIVALAIVFCFTGFNNAKAVDHSAQNTDFILITQSDMHGKILANKINKELELEYDDKLIINIGQALNLARKDKVLFNIMVDALIYLAEEAKAEGELVNLINSLAKDYKNNIFVPFNKADEFWLRSNSDSYINYNEFIKVYKEKRLFLYENIRKGLSENTAYPFREPSRYSYAAKTVKNLLAAGTAL